MTHGCVLELGASALAAAVVAAPLPAYAIDRVRAQIGVDAAVSRFGVSGAGVAVAIMDRGIDWRNADFRNDDGTTRIAYIFDLTDDAGAFAPGNPYGVGTIYTRAQVDAALAGGPALATRDAVGHGTTTAALAAGNGRNRTDRLWRGIAPRATLLVVKITSDGAPAHDGEAAEAPFWDPSRIPVAIDFVKTKAEELDMPCVMLLNLGSQIGPTDGSSSLARKIDATVGPGKSGIAFVTGTGDDGGMDNRAGGNVPSGGTRTIAIQKGATGSLYFDLWYPGADRFEVTISAPTGTFGPYAPPATNSDSQMVGTSEFLYYHQGSSVAFYGSNSGKREIWVRLDGPTGGYWIQLRGVSVSTGRFDATLNPSQIWNSSNVNRVTSEIAPGSIWDGATAFNNIAPNSYVVRTAWTDVDGNPQQLVGQGAEGELWRGSSVGPTFDGRLGVDVSSPGDRVVTTYNPTSWWATFRYNLIQGGEGLYGIAGAVSAAAPIITGLVALMLERNPTLDAPRIKQILQQTATSDAFTGTVPNPSWGFGKVDALKAVSAASPQTRFYTLTPCRLVDTRTPAGAPALVAGESRTFAVSGACGVPVGASAVSVNLAVALAGSSGNVRVFAAGTAVPPISSINYSVGQTRSNNAVVRLGANGKLAVRAAQATGTTVHFILDVNGYFE
jgi:hypothetical protein